MSQDDCLCSQTLLAFNFIGYTAVGGGNDDGCCGRCDSGCGAEGGYGFGVFDRGRDGSIG